MKTHWMAALAVAMSSSVVTGIANAEEKDQAQGVDLSTFFTQSTPETQAFQNISKPNVNTFLFAGMQGRFDIPTGSDSSRVASR